MPGHCLHVQAGFEPSKQPGLGANVRRAGPEAGKPVGKVAAESGSLVELERVNHAPGQAVAAKDVGQGLQLHRRGENGGRDEGFGGFEAERRSRGCSQFHLGGGIVLIGHDEAIEQAQQKQAADGGDHQPAPAQQYLPQLAQRRGGPLPAHGWGERRIRLCRQHVLTLRSIRHG